MNNLYSAYRQKHARGQYDWLSSQNVRMVLCTAGYVFNEDHEFLNSIGAGFRVATSEVLANKTAQGGYCGGDPIAFLSLPVEQDVASMVLFADTGDEATDFLIAFLDSAVGLPFTTHGGGLKVNWDATVNAIFRL